MNIHRIFSGRFFILTEGEISLTRRNVFQIYIFFITVSVIGVNAETVALAIRLCFLKGELRCGIKCRSSLKLPCGTNRTQFICEIISVITIIV